MEPPRMDDQITQVLLERYLAGEATLPERERVERWMAADPERRAYVESLRALGEAWARERPRFDSRAAWGKVAGRVAPEPAEPKRRPELERELEPELELEPGAAATPDRRRAERRTPEWGAALRVSSRRAAVRRWLAAGAVAAAALGAVVVGTRTHSVETPAPVPAPREYATAAAQRMTMMLPDGTRLWLAPESRLVVDGDYGRATRTVRLEGQAYFEVTHDDARPFRVRARNTVAWDLGTKFTVRAYAGESVRVAVEEGSVAIPQALAAPLLPGDLAVVDSAGRGTVRRGVELGRYTAWTKGTLEFRDTPVAEAVADLARWYRVDVRLGDPKLTRRHITVAITETSFEAALDLVAPAIGARYERRGSVVVLHSLPTP